MQKANKKILVFDDDDDLVEVITTVLSILGWEVFSYNTCNDVIERVAAINPAVIFMDNWIPDNGGINATRALKTSDQKHIPVIYFTANNDIADLANEAQADSYLSKPFNISDIENVLAAVLKTGTP